MKSTHCQADGCQRSYGEPRYPSRRRYCCLRCAHREYMRRYRTKRKAQDAQVVYDERIILGDSKE